MSNSSRQNSADRVLAIIESAFQKDRSKSSTDVWASVFGILEIDALEKQRLVSDYLSAVGAELILIERALDAICVPEHLFRAPVSRMRNAFSVGALNSKWDDHAGRHLDAETRMALKWVAYTLPKDTENASIEELENILGLLDDLDAQLADETLPAALKLLLQKHATEMRSAVKLFPVQGAAGLRKAVRATLVDIQLDEDDIRHAAEQGDPTKVRAALGILGAVFKGAAKIAGDLEKLYKGGSLMKDVIAEGAKYLGLPGA